MTLPSPGASATPSPAPNSASIEPATRGRTHTAGSAAILLMASAFASGLLGLVRIKYINYLFGAGPAQDAYRAAFKLPDLISYFMVGGAVSISLVTILNRYRESGDTEGEDRALSVILTTMLVVLAAGVVLGEIFAPQYIWLANKGFRHDELRTHLCTVMTRLILPAQLFFFIGSAMSARLQIRKIFIYQAGAPLMYNLGIILGAVFLHRRLGIYSLSIGVLVGVVFGSFFLNSLGAFRTGLHYRPIVDFRAAAFREWFRLTWPLMVGVSLVMFDGFFLNYFGSLHEGGITLLGNAKDLFSAPFNVIGPAAGAASLPFFASLFQQGRAADFSRAVSRAVSRLLGVGLLVSAWMIALGPWLMDLFRGGRFSRANAATIAHLFTILAITLAVWAVQGIYARAFYAASDTITPAITGTVITLASVPIYYVLFHTLDLSGLAIASDIGIVIQTASLAVLLHRKRLVSFADLEFGELGRSLLAALLSLAAAAFATKFLPPVSTYVRDLETIAGASAVWVVVAGAMLLATGSKLPKQILRRG